MFPDLGLVLFDCPRAQQICCDKTQAPVHLKYDVVDLQVLVKSSGVYQKVSELIEALTRKYFILLLKTPLLCLDFQPE